MPQDLDRLQNHITLAYFQTACLGLPKWPNPGLSMNYTGTRLISGIGFGCLLFYA